MSIHGRGFVPSRIKLTLSTRETLTYWVQRMEPLIRAETEEEIIIVFCNRCGLEDETVYAGSSAVIGIKQGEVCVYGLLGRCEKSVLVVDTDNPPLGKLILQTRDRVESEASPERSSTEPGSEPTEESSIS